MRWTPSRPPSFRCLRSDRVEQEVLGRRGRMARPTQPSLYRVAAWTNWSRDCSGRRRRANGFWSATRPVMTALRATSCGLCRSRPAPFGRCRGASHRPRPAQLPGHAPRHHRRITGRTPGRAAAVVLRAQSRRDVDATLATVSLGDTNQTLWGTWQPIPPALRQTIDAQLALFGQGGNGAAQVHPGDDVVRLRRA